MNYLETALGIYNWLAKHQVTQRQIIASYGGENAICFEFEHPIEGIIKIKQPMPDQRFFLCRGIGLKITKKTDDRILLDVYDHGGIFDPLDYRVQGEHYSATHFALLSAILYNETKETHFLQRAKMAIDFHLRTSKDEYYFSTWEYGYHWDFQNYAFLETYHLLQNYLSEEEEQKWLAGLKSWKVNTHFLTNWVAMRAYSFLFRFKLTNSKLDKLKYLWYLRYINRAFEKDGCFEDDPGKSRPIQYHVFTLAILHRIFLLTKDEKISRQLLAGINYFKNFIDPDGAFNYFGRGQEQIFGYGAALYILEAAKSFDSTNRNEYQYYINKISKYLMQFKRNEHFPLVLNDRPDEQKFGWYDYHHLTVYNAFLGAWLGLAHLQNPEERMGKGKEPKRAQISLYRPTQTTIISNEEYFCVICGGEKEYSSETGLSPQHLWFKEVGWIFTCPGGPSPEKFGKINTVKNLEKNYFAPIAQNHLGEWIVPAFKKGEIRKTGLNTIQALLDYGPFVVGRTLYFTENEMLFKDNIFFKRNCDFKEIRYFNLPVVIDKFKINLTGERRVLLISKRGGIEFSIIESDFNQEKIEKLELVKTAKGLAQVLSLRELNPVVRRSENKTLKLSIKRINS